MKKVKALVLRAAGVNCNKESVKALEMAGAARVDEIHINVIKKNSSLLKDYHLMVIPGGFSYGDYVGAGKILANEIKFILYDSFKEFVREGKIVIGICNGFQILVKTGFLTLDESLYDQSFSLIENDSRRFECRWVHLKINTGSLFFKKLPEVIYLPVAHNEGKFVAGQQENIHNLKDQNRVGLYYCMDDGSVCRGQYPFNPNGAEKDIAGIINSKGNVLGMMPHPERFILSGQHPFYQSLKWNKMKIHPFGLEIFKNAVRFS
ncbi:MAG: phosphoribosylformylglycinamidine synthase I [Spirochaetes bacterium]|nr:phosphoribosylformylglycinamidine synthase I [Spirochaetota bacterium]